MFFCSVFIEGTLQQHFHVFVEVAPSLFSQWESCVGDWWAGERYFSRLSSSHPSNVSCAISFWGHFPPLDRNRKGKKKGTVDKLDLAAFVYKKRNLANRSPLCAPLYKMYTIWGCYSVMVTLQSPWIPSYVSVCLVNSSIWLLFSGSPPDPERLMKLSRCICVLKKRNEGSGEEATPQMSQFASLWLEHNHMTAWSWKRGWERVLELGSERGFCYKSGFCY